jgi:hypothetical protein
MSAPHWIENRSQGLTRLSHSITACFRKRQVSIEAVVARVRDLRMQKGMSVQQDGRGTGVSQ